MDMQKEPSHFESLYPENSCETEIAKMVTYIREGSSCQLVGLPGSGRSNVLGFLAYNKDIRLKHFPTKLGFVHFVMVNFSEVKGRNFSDVMKFLFLSLVTSLHERDMKKEYEHINTLFKDSLSYNDELVLTQSLKNAIDYLSLENKLTIIFLFDRFDEYIPQITPELFTNLRALRDRAKYRFSVIFSLSRPLEESLEPQIYADFSDFIAGRHVYLKLYDAPSIQFRIEYLKKLTGKTLSEKEKDEIIALTGGHLRLTKVAVESLFSEENKLEDLRQFLLSQSTMRAALKSIQMALTPEDITDLMTGGENGYLRKIGLVNDGGVTVPLLSEYLHIEKSPIEDRIIFDETTQVIRKGNLVLSDSLTRAEFRLLRYFLQNEGRVIERDEIVSAVWGDGLSTEGVSEQAIDQLIFRLRRKIELDPNQPQLLQTVKGRGVKFSQQ